MKGFFKFIQIVVILVIIQSILVGIVDLFKVPPIKLCQDESMTYQEPYGYVTHQRAWYDRSMHHDYCMDYGISDSASQVASRQKQTISPVSNQEYNEYWGDVYQSLATANAPLIDHVVDSLSTLREEEELAYTDFAKVIVSWVQDIPYHYVVSADCTSEYANHPCYANQKYGITAPAEFLHTLHGDCDSRTVLLYTILRKFDFDPVVLISYKYAHSMLALDIPSTGDYLEIKGRKYYFWETTGEGWEVGMLPPGMDNKDYWNIALKHEL